ncbi:uncharacterized [Tachysurus ichikawai]
MSFGDPLSPRTSPPSDDEAFLSLPGATQAFPPHRPRTEAGACWLVRPGNSSPNVGLTCWFADCHTEQEALKLTAQLAKCKGGHLVASQNAIALESGGGLADVTCKGVFREPLVPGSGIVISDG